MASRTYYGKLPARLLQGRDGCGTQVREHDNNSRRRQTAATQLINRNCKLARRALVKRSSQIQAAAEEAWPATWKTLSLFQVNGSQAASSAPCSPPHRLQFVSGRELCNLLRNSCRLLLIFDSLTKIKIMDHLDERGSRWRRNRARELSV
jgi:hypothetical protein